MAKVTRGRIDAFKDALLNTCVRINNALSEEHRTSLTVCRQDRRFCEHAYRLLLTSYFQPAIEQSMGIALTELKVELYQKVWGKEAAS